MHVHLFRLNPKSHQWYAQVYVGGKRHRFTCHTANRVAARKYAEKRAKDLEDCHNRGLGGLPQPLRVSEVFNRYEREELPKLRPSSRYRTHGIVKQASRWFVSGAPRDPLISNIRPDDIAAFLESKRAHGAGPRTINLYRATLHRIFRLCVRPWLLIQTNPVAATEVLREEPREPRLLSETEYRRLLSQCGANSMLKLFVQLAWETGARSGELLQLEWSDLNFEQHQITFRNDASKGRQTKGRRSRTVPVSKAALLALRNHAAAFRFSAPISPNLFKHLQPKRGARPGDRIERLYRSFKKTAGVAGLMELRPHDLRHCFVTRKLAEGVAVQLVSKYVGHADLATTMRYTHLIPEHLRAVVG